MAELIPVQLTPEQEAEFAAKTSAPAGFQPFDPVAELDSAGLAEMQVNKVFDPVVWARQNPERVKDQQTFQKLAEGNAAVRERGFVPSDFFESKTLPGRAVEAVTKPAGAFAHWVGALGKSAFNYANVLGAPLVSALGDITGQGPEFQAALAQQIDKRAAEGTADLELAMQGMGSLFREGSEFIGRQAATDKQAAEKFLGTKFFTPPGRSFAAAAVPWGQMSPGQKAEEFRKEIDRAELAEDTARGEGPFTTMIGGEVVKELKEAGTPVDPEQVATLAEGNPLALMLFGKGFHVAGKLVTPAGSAMLDRAAGKAGELAVKGTGRALEIVGKTAKVGGTTAKVAAAIAPAVGFIAGVAEGNPLAALAGKGGGEIARSIFNRLSKAAGTPGDAAISGGRQLAGKAEMASPYAQLASDIIRNAPAAVKDVTAGAGIDYALAAATAETPEETSAVVPLGMAFGAVKGLGRTVRGVVQGQLLAPRPWGATESTPAYGSFSALDGMNADATRTLAPDKAQRVNAIRAFLRPFGVEAYAAGSKEAAAEAFKRVVLRGRDPATVSPAEMANIDSLASQVGEAQGMFTADLTDDTGKSRRIVLMNNVDAAPHEAFHGIQDVLGDAGNRAVDALVYQHYTPTEFRNFGRLYAERRLGRALASGESWQAAILDSTGYGNSAMTEKVYRDAYNKLAGETGAAPSEANVKVVAEDVLRQARESQAGWREILTPEEAAQEANKYLAREVAAENFETVFKNLGANLKEGNALPQKLARVVANFIALTGSEPLAGAKVPGLMIEPKFGLRAPVIEMTQEARPSPGTTAPVTPTIPRGAAPTTPVTPEERKGEGARVQTIADEFSARDPATAEVLRRVATAISNGTGIKVEYRSAPGEPAGAPNMSREQRRQIIEAFRDMPESVRPLWEKTNFPDQVLPTKDKGFQIVGWSPENFAANAHRMAGWLEAISSAAPDIRARVPYEIDPQTKSFTPQAWQQLHSDAIQFVKNQQAGGTGSGQPLRLPANAAEMKVRVPTLEDGALVPMEQSTADFHNLLFNVMLPETVRVSRKGGTPGNIVAQEIAATNEPFIGPRVGEPGRPRKGAGQEFKGFPGRTIKEVNPLRSEFERAAESTGVKLPSLIETNQRLNLEHVADVTLVPEAPAIRGVTDTLRAGFKPAELIEGTTADTVNRVKALDEAGWFKATSSPEALEAGGLTGIAYSMGEKTATVADVSALRQAEKQYADETRAHFSDAGFARQRKEPAQAMEALKRAQVTATKKQFFSEALQKVKPELLAEEAALPKPVEPLPDIIEETPRTQAKPSEGNEEIRSLAGTYAKAAGIDYAPSRNYAPVNSDLGKRLADFYESAESKPGDPGVKASYDALAKETIDQWKTITDAGYTLEPFTGKGEPYKSSAEMMADVDTNKHLFFLPTEGNISADASNLLLKASGIKGYPINDIFRAVHDFFGHAKEGTQFGPRGEFNAWKTHSEMYSDGAQGALAAETLAQNSWVNFGQHLRDASGKIPAAGEPGYKTPSERPFAEQKYVLVPQELIEEARGIAAQFKPSDEPDAIKGPAVNVDGKIFTGGTHSEAYQKAGSPERIKEAQQGFVTNSGEFLSRKEAFKRAKEFEQISGEEWTPSFGRLESVTFESASRMQFSPADPTNKSEQIFSPSVRDTKTGKTYLGFLHGHAFMNALATGEIHPGVKTWEDFQKVSASVAQQIENRFESGYMTTKNRFVDRVEGGKIGQAAGQVRGELKGGVSPEGERQMDSLDIPLYPVEEGKTQFKPKDKEFKLLSGGPAGVSKAWILPSGKVEQLGGQWHHHWLEENPEVAKKYNLTIPPFEGNDTEGVRESALRAGFARVNYQNNSGTLTVEARAKDWRKLKPVMERFVEVNLDSIDNMRVHLLNEKGDKAIDSDSAKLFDLDTDAEKLANIPFITKSEPRVQFKPESIPETETLPGMEKTREFAGAAIANMTVAELAKHFPESVTPKTYDESIPSNILGSPLFKRSVDEAEAVTKFSDRLVEFAKEYQDRPEFKAGAKWYSDFTPRLKKEFGKDAPLFAELLAATSPQIDPQVNFRYAYDAFLSWESGRFDKTIAKFNEGLEKIQDGSWEKYYARDVGLGKAVNPPANPSPATFLAHWIEKFDLKPRQSNGKLYGSHSIPVLQVMARTWLDANKGPKTANFVENLIGASHEATIDLWADRTMRWAGYEGFKDRWRIMPKNATGVTDEDFAFSQKVFRAAATELGMKPDALQGALWFAEKQRWADNGWGRLSLGDYRKEIKKAGLLKTGFEQRTRAQETAKKAKPAATQSELAIEPKTGYSQP